MHWMRLVQVPVPVPVPLPQHHSRLVAVPVQVGKGTLLEEATVDRHHFCMCICVSDQMLCVFVTLHQYL